MATNPLCFCASMTACASRQESASGISTCTCLPAFRQATDCAACIWVGVQRMTASTSPSERLSASSVVTCAMPYLAATSRVGSSLRPTSETTSTPSMFLMPSRCLIPKAPAPASATLIVLVTSIVLQNQMPHGRVAGRHMVKPMPHSRRLAAIHIVHRATRDQPHHQLDALAAGFADVIDVRHRGKSLGIANQAIEEGRVEFLVDQPGTGSLQLMAHATGTPDLNVERLVKCLHGLADGFTEHVATPGRGRRVLHDIDRKRDHRTWPRLRLTAHQAQRHRQAMVDIHLVDDGEIEVVLDHRLRNMSGKFRMADYFRHRARAPTFVGRHEFRRGADRKRRDYVEAECVGMIIVDQKNDVRLVILQPLLGIFVALEDPLPIWLARLAEVERRADRGDVRGVDAVGNAGHYFFSSV